MAQLMSIKKNVDVQPGAGVPAIFHCSQGDKGTRIILGLLNNNDSYTIPEGTTAIIRGSRADGTLFTEITADIDTTTEIKFNLTEDMTSVAGPVECEAVMTSGTANVIGTANFIIDVEKSPASIGSVFPATDAAETWLIDELTNLDISGLDNESVVDAINNKASESTIAPEFSASASYTAGQMVLKNGVLYRFTADHSAGAWTGTDAVETTVETEIKRESATDEQVQTAVDNWLDEHPEATTTVEDGSLLLTKINHSVIIIPDQFTGNDTEKLQQALDAAIPSGVVLINRAYTINSTVILKNPDAYPVNTIRVIGICKESVINVDCAVGFSRLSGQITGYRFNNIVFVGNSENILISCDDGTSQSVLSRCFFESCDFKYFNHVLNSQYIMQEYYFSNCLFSRNTGVAINIDLSSYCVHITSSFFEGGNGLLWHNQIRNGERTINTIIRDNTIEGNQTTAIKLGRSLEAVIEGNYFENNNAAYTIDLTESSISSGLNISHNINAITPTSENVFICLPPYSNICIGKIEFNETFGTMFFVNDYEIDSHKLIAYINNNKYITEFKTGSRSITITNELDETLSSYKGMLTYNYFTSISALRTKAYEIMTSNDMKMPVMFAFNMVSSSFPDAGSATVATGVVIRSSSTALTVLAITNYGDVIRFIINNNNEVINPGISSISLYQKINDINSMLISKTYSQLSTMYVDAFEMLTTNGWRMPVCLTADAFSANFPGARTFSLASGYVFRNNSTTLSVLVQANTGEFFRFLYNPDNGVTGKYMLDMNPVT